MATATKTKDKDNSVPVPDWKLRLTVGHKYFVQTCTKDWVGMCLLVAGPYTVVLGPDPDQEGSQAAWSAESGRLHAFLRDGKAEGMELETLERGQTVCCQWVNWIPWEHPLPTESV